MKEEAIIKKTNQRDASENKKRIAAVAKELFSQKGYLATSIEDIVSASQSSKGNLYHHFKSKEGLFLYLINEQVNEWIEQWTEKEQTYKHFSEKLYGLADHSLEDLKNPLIKAAEEFGGSQTADPIVLKKVVEALNKQRDIFQRILREGIAHGEIEKHDEEQLTFILFALIAGLGSLYNSMEFDELKALHHKAVSVFLHGVVKKKDI
ncbi:TetR/AcrR family transcriptional regulator [Bacillus chungangensis]|uniref:AcrR family transcriptional regulator n=1 Tax=Bacillus chungangensis TaxID=587633 RepID=A0ABT9WY07_9BACI|nr:TetR/AcrR family transcriptional regulator [Bacillus chungangensis]MDQ0177993.1 AcrR family transcriptional regulator [Bacillus chungangensis]